MLQYKKEVLVLVETLDDVIELCGGNTAVSKVLKVNRKTVWGWRQKGLPRTEWTCETFYAEQLQAMCLISGVKLTADQILELSK